MQALAAAELLEDLQVVAGATLLGRQLLDEALQGAADADQRHRLARLVEDDGQAGVLGADLAQDVLGERGHLLHGERGELPYLPGRHVAPRGAEGGPGLRRRVADGAAVRGVADIGGTG